MIDSNPELSVVVLCYRSEESVPDFVRQLESELLLEKVSFELILVANFDKGSLDRTPIIAAEVAKGKENIKVVAKPKEGRMGWDMRSGFDAARGQYIAVIDGDGQMPVSDIPIVYRLIKTGKYDLVKTFRIKRFDGWHRKLLSSGYNFLFRILFNPFYPMHDVNSKPKIMTRGALQTLHLVSNDWFTDAEIMIECLRHQQRICEVGTIFYKNDRRRSFVNYRTIMEFVINLFYYRFKLKK